MNEELKQLTRRVLTISYKHKLSHLGSCLTALPIIWEIYEKKAFSEKFVLSCGHAGLALYVVLEKYYTKIVIPSGEANNNFRYDAERMLELQGIHPDRLNNYEAIIDCSTGSLGHGLPIALGMALADRTKNVYCLISDGECAEGSIWEVLTIKKKYKADNLKVYANINGFSAYDAVDRKDLSRKLKLFCPDINLRQSEANYKFWPGLKAHYHVMTEDEYKQTMELLI